MNDFTKIKLINSLIDAVSHFYEYKQKSDGANRQHLKGFCEGLAYSLVEQEILDSNEAKKILQGLGKKREPKEVETKSQEPEPDNLDIPTIFRKNKTPTLNK